MARDGLSRRRLLATLGVAAGSTAGCQSLLTQSSQESTEAGASPTPQSPRAGAESDADSVYAQVYEQVADAVVSIQVYSEFGQPAQGSGFLLDDSHIVTNEHVVASGETVYVRFVGTDWREVTVVGTDVYSDLAVIRVGAVPDSVEPLSFISGRPSIGTRVVAIGNPFGLTGSVSEGIVSGVNRTLRGANNFSIAAAIQTDAAVNPGNSGGPLVDLDGNVLGVINSGGGDNVGFAISAQLARRVIPALVADGDYDHPYMGVRLSSVTPLVAEANDLEQAAGVYISFVQPGGPAAGTLQGSTGTATVEGTRVDTGGDVIRALDGTPIPTRQDLASYLALQTSPGDRLSATVQRDGSVRTVQFTLGTRPAP